MGIPSQRLRWCPVPYKYSGPDLFHDSSEPAVGPWEYFTVENRLPEESYLLWMIWAARWISMVSSVSDIQLVSMVKDTDGPMNHGTDTTLGSV